MFPQCFYMLTDTRFQKEMSYQGRIIILSCIYFTSIVLQIETDAWSAQTHRVKERVFNMSCLTGSTKLKRNDETKTSVLLISFAIWQRFFMYWERLFSRRTQSDQSDHSKGIQQTVSLTASDSFTGVVGFPKAYIWMYDFGFSGTKRTVRITEVSVRRG